MFNLIPVHLLKPATILGFKVFLAELNPLRFCFTT